MAARATPAASAFMMAMYLSSGPTLKAAWKSYAEGPRCDVLKSLVECRLRMGSAATLARIACGSTGEKLVFTFRSLELTMVPPARMSFRVFMVLVRSKF
jgi:hypothetical protein